MHSKNVRPAPLALALLGFLVGCGGGGSGVVVGGDYPIAYLDRSVAAAGEAADGVVFVPGGDLYLRELSSPNASARNITREYTQGRGDVAGPEASYDGRRLVFSMRGPNDPTWNIWEYSLDSGTLRRVIPDDETANAGDDLDPHYLPDGRIVFTSSRQAGSRAQLEQAGVEPYSYRDGYGREAALVLHVMNADGSGIEQISFNQSHDRNPTVRMNGELLYARWEHMGNRNQQPIFTIRPDGRQLDVLYGAFSPGDSFLHPRELPDGRIISTVLPLAGVRNGGALVIADVLDHTDHQRRLDGTAGAGQYQPTLYELPLGRVPSPKGRYTTPYPLWDRSGRVLVAWSPQQRGGTASPLLPGETEPRYGIYMLNLNDRSLRPIAFAETGRVLTDPVALIPRPRPAIIAPATPPDERLPVEPRPFPCPDGTWRESCDGIPEPEPEPVCPDGFRPRPFPPNECEPEPEPEPVCPDGYRPRPFPMPPDECEPEPKPDPVCPDGYRPRPFPTPTPTPPDECEPDPGPGPGPDPDPGPGPGPGPSPDSQAILNIRSVYDTDFLDSMGDSVLVAGEQIPRSADGRPDLARLRDASQTSAAERPARFLRVSRAVPLPPGLALDTVSGTAFKMQQLLGYAPIEPDGSVRVAVPPDTPLSLAVVDAHGRAFQTHTSWLQARPGEERTCHGCHSPHRSAAPLNTGSPAGGPFEGSTALFSALPGETMAETRTRLEPEALRLQASPSYRDVWTDPASAGRPRDPSHTISYAGLPADARPSGGIIDYVSHIQPIWQHNCVSCHGAGSSLDLSDRLATSGRLRSYDNLVLGRPTASPLATRDDRIVILREPPLVDVGGSANSSRSSHLLERLYEQELLAPQPVRSGYDHSGLLNASELRLLAEWIDLGAPYRNAPPPADPDPAAGRTELDPLAFAQNVHPMLLRRCVSCHLPSATSGNITAPNHRNPDYAPNRFALTGNATADFGAAAAMVTDACNAASSPLLRRPTSTERGALAHPSVVRSGPPETRGPLLQAGDPDYLILRSWIEAGCR